MGRRIAVDVDGVCAALGAAWLAAYNQDYDDDLTEDQVKTWAIHEYVKPTCGRRIYDYLTPALYDQVQPIPGAQAGVAELQRLGFEVVYVTATPQGCEGAKLAWLKRHGFLTGGGLYGDGRVYANYVETANKALIQADLLIDDGAHNIASWPNLGLLFDAHHNQAYATARRVHGWDGVLAFVRAWAPPDQHPTERRSPNQARRFRELLDQMYQVHLDKNADYSPANILGTGMLGCLVRLWDKLIRLLNLMGFDIEARLVAYTGPKLAKNEGIEDTLLDLANYAVIARLVWEDKWGN